MGISWNMVALGTAENYETSFHIYPNPVKNTIHIKGVSKSAQVFIYDTLGRKVLETKINESNNAINVSGLSGMYWVNIVCEGKKITKLLAIKLEYKAK